MQLSQRLQCLADWTALNSRVADIGTDHAYLAVWLAQSGKSSYLVAGDLNRDPYLRAVQTVTKHGLTEKISVRLGNGLQIVQDADRIDTVIIAGMGGNTIRQILIDGSEKLASVRHLLLQPMSDSADLRCWLAGCGWRLQEEALVAEDDHFYELLCAVRGRETACGLPLQVGPRLLERHHPLLQVYLQTLVAQRQHIVWQLSNSNSSTARDKARRLHSEIESLQQLLREEQKIAEAGETNEHIG